MIDCLKSGHGISGIVVSGGQLSHLYGTSQGSLFALQLTSSAMPMPVGILDDQMPFLVAEQLFIFFVE
jgi:hypothetical protein